MIVSREILSYGIFLMRLASSQPVRMTYPSNDFSVRDHGVTTRGRRRSWHLVSLSSRIFL